MAMTRVAGKIVTGTTDFTAHTGAGRLYALLLSTIGDARGDTVTVKDGSATIATLIVHSYNSPFFVKFGEDKLDGIPFTTSLIVNQGANCKVNVWYYGY
jgi:hypothetical protein